MARESLHDLLANAGEAIAAMRLRGLPPEKRARVALARLRDAGIKPERLLALAVAVRALIREAPQVCHRIKDWRICALAKAAHRLKSGTHKRWLDDSGAVLSEMHVYPRPAGLVLRRLGAMIETAAEAATERQHIAAVVDLKVERFGPHPAIADPLRFAAEADSRARRGGTR